MGTIGFTNKPILSAKEEVLEIIQENTDWYRPYCINCPYFINDEQHTKMLHCVRPTGQDCLADNVLVAGHIMQQAQAEHLRQMQTAAATRVEQRKSIPHKRIKRRR